MLGTLIETIKKKKNRIFFKVDSIKSWKDFQCDFTIQINVYFLAVTLYFGLKNEVQSLST